MLQSARRTRSSAEVGGLWAVLLSGLRSSQLRNRERLQHPPQLLLRRQRLPGEGVSRKRSGGTPPRLAQGSRPRPRCERALGAVAHVLAGIGCALSRKGELDIRSSRGGTRGEGYCGSAQRARLQTVSASPPGPESCSPRAASAQWLARLHRNRRMRRDGHCHANPSGRIGLSGAFGQAAVTARQVAKASERKSRKVEGEMR